MSASFAFRYETIQSTVNGERPNAPMGGESKGVGKYKLFVARSAEHRAIAGCLVAVVPVDQVHNQGAHQSFGKVAILTLIIDTAFLFDDKFLEAQGPVGKFHFVPPLFLLRVSN